MAKDFAKYFYKSQAWQRCRDGYIAERIMIDGGTCEVCREEPGYILHHKTTLTPSNIGDADVSLNWNNLRWECKNCHDKEEGHGVANKKAELLVSFDAMGQPVPLPEPPLLACRRSNFRGPVGELDVIRRRIHSTPSPMKEGDEYGKKDRNRPRSAD